MAAGEILRGQDLLCYLTLPKAAQMYRQVIARGIDKNPEAATHARLALRQLIGGEITLTPDYAAGHLIAKLGLNKIALFNRASETHRFSGSGGVLPIDLPDVRLVRRRKRH